jgi:hypothetical protein
MYMYVQAADYYDDLRRMRAEASKIVGNVRKTIAEKPTYEFKISRYKDDVDWEDEGKGHVSLHFSMPDFYLKGIQNHANDTLYVFKESKFTVDKCKKTQILKFKEDYAAMGWNKSQDQITVSLDNVEEAFDSVFRGFPTQKAVRSIVIAFAEGFRFAKIAKKVANGEPIGGKELDWSAAGATVEKGP